MKALRIIVGSLSGAVWAAFLSAAVFWILAATESSSGYPVHTIKWVTTAAFIGGFVGLVLGLFLSVLNRGSVFGAFSGGMVSLLFFLGVILLVMLNWKPRDFLTIVALFAVGPISGFLTALIVSALSPKSRNDDDYVLLNIASTK